MTKFLKLPQAVDLGDTFEVSRVPAPQDPATGGPSEDYLGDCDLHDGTITITEGQPRLREVQTFLTQIYMLTAAAIHAELTGTLNIPELTRDAINKGSALAVSALAQCGVFEGVTPEELKAFEAANEVPNQVSVSPTPTSSLN